MLYITGGILVMLGLQKNPEYLANAKLQAKFILVALLTANAVLLHRVVFPILARSDSVSQWRRMDWAKVASSVSVSNSIWFFCAFLGIARVWNNTVSITYVLTVFAILCFVMFVLVNAVLLFASRDAPKPQPDWVDTAKAKLCSLA